MPRKLTVCVLTLTLLASGCASVPPARPLPECPNPPAVPAWIMQPAPSLIPLLDSIISPSVEVSEISTGN